MCVKLEEHLINSQNAAVPQYNSFCLKINHLEEMTTGSVNTKIVKKTKNFKDYSGTIRI